MSVNGNPFLEDYRDFAESIFYGAESIILRSSKYNFTELEV